MINTKPASQLSIWAREEGHVSVVRVSLHVSLTRVLFTISPNRELARGLDDEMLQTGVMRTPLSLWHSASLKINSKNFNCMKLVSLSGV